MSSKDIKGSLVESKLPFCRCQPIPFIGALASLLSLPYIYGLATLLYLDGKDGPDVQSKMPKTAVEVS